jgi:hypothetical protein
MERDTLFASVLGLQRAHAALVVFSTAVSIELVHDSKKSYPGTVTAAEKWAEAIDNYDAKRMIASIVCEKKTNEAFFEAVLALGDGAERWFRGDITGYAEVFHSVMRAVRNAFQALAKSLRQAMESPPDDCRQLEAVRAPLGDPANRSATRSSRPASWPTWTVAGVGTHTTLPSLGHSVVRHRRRRFPRYLSRHSRRRRARDTHGDFQHRGPVGKWRTDLDPRRPDSLPGRNLRPELRARTLPRRRRSIRSL